MEDTEVVLEEVLEEERTPSTPKEAIRALAMAVIRQAIEDITEITEKYSGSGGKIKELDVKTAYFFLFDQRYKDSRDGWFSVAEIGQKRCIDGIYQKFFVDDWDKKDLFLGKVNDWEYKEIEYVLKSKPKVPKVDMMAQLKEYKEKLGDYWAQADSWPDERIGKSLAVTRIKLCMEFVCFLENMKVLLDANDIKNIPRANSLIANLHGRSNRMSPVVSGYPSLSDMPEKIYENPNSFVAEMDRVFYKRTKSVDKDYVMLANLVLQFIRNEPGAEWQVFITRQDFSERCGVMRTGAKTKSRHSYYGSQIPKSKKALDTRKSMIALSVMKSVQK